MNLAQYATLFFIFLNLVLRFRFFTSSVKIKVVYKAPAATDRALMYMVLTGTVILPVVWACTSLFHFADYTGKPEWMWLGCLLRLFAAFLFYRSHKDLGGNWSDKLELRTGHQLVCKGIYKYVRHPMYASMLLALAVQCLYLTNYVIAPLAFLSYFILYLCRVPQEERMMVQQFGEQYIAYRQKTYGLFPKF
jgi:protein-S-isoprenylcysteine O-methyltransferase Ste14